MPELFEETRLGSMVLRNRFVRSATWEGMADKEGAVADDRLPDCLAALARGGVGLVVAGAAYVNRQGQLAPFQTGVHHPDMAEGLSRVARAVHEAGGVVAAQLGHAGAKALTHLTGLPAIGPVAAAEPGKLPVLAMDDSDMARLRGEFARAAELARTCGFDAVQVHAAHGYLLSQFLSPHYNTRADDHGGSLANRARLGVEVIRAVRAAVGPEYPVLVKINAADYLDGGLTVADAVEAAALFEAAGVDAVEISGGTGESGRMSPARPGSGGLPEGEPYYREAAVRMKRRLSVPVMLVGGIRSVETAEALLADGAADYVCLARPLIREPDLVARWRAGDRTPSGCVADNRCSRPGLVGRGIACMTLKKS